MASGITLGESVPVCMDGWMDGWMVGWMDGWMDGRTETVFIYKAYELTVTCIHIYIYICMYIHR